MKKSNARESTFQMFAITLYNIDQYVLINKKTCWLSEIKYRCKYFSHLKRIIDFFKY